MQNAYYGFVTVYCDYLVLGCLGLRCVAQFFIHVAGRVEQYILLALGDFGGGDVVAGFFCVVLICVLQVLFYEVGVDFFGELVVAEFYA